jgi:hypothetical protein
MIDNPESLATQQLLQCYAQILKELRLRKIIRTSNNPVGDYTEWLVAKQLGLTLAANSTSGYDAVDSAGVKYQIKGRRLTSANQSRQLSAIRNLKNHDFDYLIAIYFNEEFEIEQVVKLPYEIIGKYGQYREHVNAHILILAGHIMLDPKIEDITRQFC